MGKIVQTTAPSSEADSNKGQTRREFLAAQPQDSQFIDQTELLRRLPVSRKTLHNWRAAGKIPSIVIGRRVLFCWENVAEALRRLERGGTQ
jgi:hypothetical protein